MLKPRGVAVLTAMQPFTTDLVASNRRGFRYALVWDKVGATGFLDANRRPLRGHEDILVFARGYTTYNPQATPGKPYVARRKGRVIETLGERRLAVLEHGTVNDGRRYPRSVVRISGANNGRGKDHPTQKPVALMDWLVRTYTNEGETVLDPYMGSGTTGVAALRLGRSFVGVEQDERFHAIAARRIAEAHAEHAAGAA